MGSMISLLVLLSIAPPSTSLAEYASIRGARGSIATWIFFPSLGLTLIAGLVAIAYSRGYHNAGWAWAKALSGFCSLRAALSAYSDGCSRRRNEVLRRLLEKPTRQTLRHRYNPGLAAALLQQTDPRVTERHYNRARSARFTVEFGGLIEKDDEYPRQNFR